MILTAKVNFQNISNENIVKSKENALALDALNHILTFADNTMESWSPKETYQYNELWVVLNMYETN